MSNYEAFIFKKWHWDPSTKMLQLEYSLDETLNFTETYRFDFDFAPNVDELLLAAAMQNLFLIAGVSYYKTFIPKTIEIKHGQVDETSAKFLDKTYQKGLGEFFYVNKLDPRTPVTFPTTAALEHRQSSLQAGQLIGIGGGKDSLVSVEILKQQKDWRLATWSVGHKSQLEPLVKRIGLPHFWVEREWDRKLLELNNQGAYNGHIPISAIFAAVGAVVAVLANYSDIVVSNESSANEPTLHYQGVAINHQYSKSLEFEKDYQAFLQHTLGDGIRYYSLLRPLSDIRIGELFVQLGFEQYKDVFSSCNRAFTHTSTSIFWDGTCSKCAFVFLALTPFIEREKLEVLFSGKNLLLDLTLEPTYKQLLGIEGEKPLECVGEIKESRQAMRFAQTIYPELQKYQFELPSGYDYKQLGSHSMPEEIFGVFQGSIAAL